MFINNLPSNSLRSLTLKALLWQSAGQTGERLARFLTNIILARLLMPADFGLAGAVTAALAAVDSAMFVGSNQAILHSDRGRRPEFLDTAFALAVVRGLIIGLALLAAAPLLSRFFAQSQATAMFALLALQPVISGLASPRSQLLLKDLRFGVWSVYQAGSNILGLLATVWLAVEFRNAWALVIGQLLTQFIVTAGSFLIAPYRPRWRFESESWHELRTYGLRASGIPLITMLILQAPAILLGRFQGMAVLGIFLLNQRLAQMPQNLFLRAVSVVALPAYSTIQHEPDRCADVWLKGLRTIGLLMLPVGAVMIALDHVLPAVLYGPQFSPLHGLFALLAVDGALISIGVVTAPLFWAVGQPSYDRNVQLIRLGVLYLAAIIPFSHDGLTGLAVGYAVSALVAQALYLGYARRIIDVTLRQLGRALAPGLILAAVVACVLRSLMRMGHLTGAQAVVFGGVLTVITFVGVLGYIKFKAGYWSREPVPQLPSQMPALAAPEPDEQENLELTATHE